MYELLLLQSPPSVYSRHQFSTLLAAFPRTLIGVFLYGWFSTSGSGILICRVIVVDVVLSLSIEDVEIPEIR